MDKNIMRVHDLAAELESISMMIAALDCQLEPDARETLSTIGADNVRVALFGVEMHIDRIVKELESMR